MKKLTCILFVLSTFLLVGCSKVRKSPVAIQIDKTEISVDEFEGAFKNSIYAKEDTLASRKNFLDVFLSRLLILKEAEKRGLDKDPEFLRNVESFWQQSLLKLMLDKKINELSSKVRVEDNEIRDFFYSHKDEFQDKELESVYEQIKWVILREKQQAALNNWIDSLKNTARMNVDYKLLKIQQ